jgi:hypothetical protein
MTEREALKLALEALEYFRDTGTRPSDLAMSEDAIAAIEEALAQPEHGWTSERIAGIARLKEAQDKKLAQPEQEPVGQLLENAFGRGQVMWFNKPKDESMLYTTPPQRTWVGLTDEEIEKVWDSGVRAFPLLARELEAKLKEKNT